MNSIYTLNKFLKHELPSGETYRQPGDKLHEDAGVDEAKPLLPSHKDDIEAIFSQALMRRLGIASCPPGTNKHQEGL
jgi:hypothetical protein